MDSYDRARAVKERRQRHRHAAPYCESFLPCLKIVAQNCRVFWVGSSSVDVRAFVGWAATALEANLFPEGRETINWVVFWSSSRGLRGQLHFFDVCCAITRRSPPSPPTSLSVSCTLRVLSFL